MRVRDTRLDISRRRSVSARPEKQRERVRIDIRDDDSEADYYGRKAEERAYIGEAYNGATKDWAIVDVPPGTERVQMDGVGGGSQEITWQRYNGVRRSKFIPERERERVEIREERREEPRRESSGLEIEISSRRREGGGTYEREYERIEETSSRQVGFPRAPPKERVGDLWTEITKDLVVREALESRGYDYEETEFFYYVLQYLRYVSSLHGTSLPLTKTINRKMSSNSFSFPKTFAENARSASERFNVSGREWRSENEKEKSGSAQKDDASETLDSQTRESLSARSSTTGDEGQDAAAVGKLRLTWQT